MAEEAEEDPHGFHLDEHVNQRGAWLVAAGLAHLAADQPFPDQPYPETKRPP